MGNLVLYDPRKRLCSRPDGLRKQVSGDGLVGSCRLSAKTPNVSGKVNQPKVRRALPGVIRNLLCAADTYFVTVTKVHHVDT